MKPKSMGGKHSRVRVGGRRSAGTASRSQAPHSRRTRRRGARRTGCSELDARTDPDALEAAAALCRSAGVLGAAIPCGRAVGMPSDLEVDGLIVVAAATPQGAVAGVDKRWATVTLDGERSIVVGESAIGPAFSAALKLSAIDSNGASDVALGLVLPCWTLLGMLDRAIELTIKHVCMRKQFGQPLSSLQGVQFQLTDAEVERSGLDILAKYALWSAGTATDDALGDALALRLAAIEAAEVVFRVCHQLTVRSGSAMRQSCRGYRGTASHYDGCRWGCRRPVRSWPTESAGVD